MRPEMSDLQTLQGFLHQTSSDNVLDYLGLEADPDAQSTAGAIQRRRRWAQARLSNPRYEAEARLVLTHHTLMARVLAAQDHDGQHLDQLRAFWRGLTLAGLPRPERMARLRVEAERIGVSAERLMGWWVVGTVTTTDCVTQEPTPASAPPITTSAPPVKPAPRPARGTRGPATRAAVELARRLTEILREGVLPVDALEDVLQSSQDRGLTPAATLAELDASVRVARREQRQQARAANRPSRDALQAALQEVCDSLRELAMHGFLDDRSLHVVELQARRNGLPREQVDELLRDAQATATHMRSNAGIPAAVLELPASAPTADIDQAWADARAEICGGALWEHAHRVVPLDMAWAVLRRMETQVEAPAALPEGPSLGGQMRMAAYAL